jgi:hypothetical protein
MRWLILASCVGGAWIGPTAGALADGRVDLTLTERSGADRSGEAVTSGVPLPKGAVRDVAQVRLVRDGRPAPAQFRAAGLWQPDASVRWLLVDVEADLRANQQARYTLEYGAGVSAGPAPAAALRIDEDETAYTVYTGAATFVVSKRRFSLFEEVRLADGTAAVSRPAAGEARFGAAVTGLKGLVTRALPAAANRGRSHLIYVRRSPDAPQEDYVLRFTSARDFEVSGAKSGPQGAGAYQKDFTSTDGRLSIPRDAWLAYAYPQQGDVYTFRTVPDGAAAQSEGVFSTDVVERGPLRSVIRVTGSFGPTNAPVLEYTAWYHFYAGSGRARLSFTLENNAHGGRTPDGNARNADIGGVNCVFFDAMTLRLPVAWGANGRFTLGGAADRDPLVGPLTARTELYQDSAGGERWDRYKDAKYQPRPNSYVTFRGYRFLRDGAAAGEGDRALGWLTVSAGGAEVGRGPEKGVSTGSAPIFRPWGVTVAVRDFWQNFPKSLSAAPDGTLEVGLFPGRYAGDFPLRTGEHKTHDVLFDFANAIPADGGKALALAFSDPLRLEPSPQWFAATRALGDLHPLDRQRYADYEVRNASTVGAFPPGVRPGASLLSRIEENTFFGWMDFGDVPIDFEAPSGQWGMKYDFDYGMLTQYARTLDAAWWRLFVAADRHTRDIDIHHQPHYPGLHYVRGGVWAHSLHDEPGNKNPHRNYNHFTKDLCFGARGTAALYYLTGDWKARAAALEIAENAFAQYMSPQEKPDPKQNNRMGWRGDACTLERLVEGYLLTGEDRFLERARWQIAACAFDGKPAKHAEISLWSSLFYMAALARYLEIRPDDQDAANSFLAHCETLRKGTDPKNGIYYAITPQPDGSVVGKGQSSHYNILAADVLAIAYEKTGDRRYLDAARLCFDYGVKNACWVGGPPTYFHVHSANGATHGNVFMAVNEKAGARP